MGAGETVKALVKGLYTEGLFQYPPSVVNETCAVNISEVVPVPGGSVLANNPLEQWLHRGYPGSVRLYFGRGPGSTVLTKPWLALGHVTVYDPVDKKLSAVNTWWEPEVIAEQGAAVAQIAAKYDGEISLIFIANGGTTYAEPFIRGIASLVTRQNLLAAGYTADADKASYVEGYKMFKAFRETRLAQAFNPWQYVNHMGTGLVDLNFTLQMIDEFCAMFPRRAVLQNNSIRMPVLSQLYQQMYDHMVSTRRPIRFQTATIERMGNPRDTLNWALNQGAHAVELSPGFQTYLSAQDLKAYDAALRAT